MFAICSRQEFVRAILGNALRVARHPTCGARKGAKRVNSRMRSPRQLLPENRNDRYHNSSRPKGSRRRGGGVLAPQSDFKALKRQEAAKRAVSPDCANQRLARAETKPAVSLGLRFVSLGLRSASLRFAETPVAVMAGLDPAIQAEAPAGRISMTTQRRLDGRVKPGHDARGYERRRFRPHSRPQYTRAFGSM
jgi:hypothetical protein